MKSMLMFLAVVPQMIFGLKATDSDSTDKEKYQDVLTPSQSLYCNDLNPQSHLDFNMLMGLWYGSEIITHHETEAYETVYDSCVVVHLADVNELESNDYDYTNYDDRSNRDHRDRQLYDNTRRNFNMNGNNRRLRLIWDERGKTLEYTLRVDNSRRGFWISAGNQKGTMLDLPYNQFTGTIQVMKAVGNHLVLTFCETLPRSQIFTIILTRKPHLLSRDEVQSVRNLLRRRGLSVQSVRKVCKNSSTTVSVSVITLVTLAVASILSRKF